MAVSKVIYGNQTIIDITDTDASAANVFSGKKFHDSAGEVVVGTAEVTVDGTTLVMPSGLITIN